LPEKKIHIIKQIQGPESKFQSHQGTGNSIIT
jgi:hypothetical protein